MRAGEKPIESWCSECQEWHWSTVLGGKIEISTSTALVKAKFCIGCGNSTTGSIGQAGYFWSNVCQRCKDEEDEFLRESLKTQRDLFALAFLS